MNNKMNGMERCDWFAVITVIGCKTVCFSWPGLVAPGVCVCMYVCRTWAIQEIMICL